MRKREMRGDRGNHHEKLGLDRMLCANQFMICNIEGTTPDPTGNYTVMRSYNANQVSYIPDVS